MSGAPSSDEKTFLVVAYILKEDVAKISKVSEISRNVNPARTIAGLVDETNYCTIFQ